MRKFVLALCIATLSASFALGQTPVPLTPSGATTDKPTFTWAATAGAQWYWVWASRQGDSSYAAVAQQWIENVTTWTPTTSIAEGDYVFWVQAWGPASGYSAWSDGLNFSVVPEKTITIPPAAFQGADGTEGRGLSAADLNPSPAVSYWYAPLSLPEGAVITKVRFFFQNNGAVGSGPELTLYRRHMRNSDAGTTMVTINRSATTASGFYSYFTTTVSQPTVDADYSYTLRAKLNNGSTYLRGMAVTYRE
jgi:hypothetical protein